MSNATTKVSKPSPKKITRTVKPDVSEESLTPSLVAGWNPIVGVCLAGIIFFGAQLLSGVLLSYYRYPKHWTDQQLLNWLDNSIVAQFLFVLFAEALVVLGVYLFVRRYKDGLRAIGLRAPRWTDPLYGLAIFLPYLIVDFIILTLLGSLIPGLNIKEKQQLGFNSVSGIGEMTLTFISLVILPPIAEEILFRGFLYSSLKKNLPKIIAVLATSALFAIGHLPEGGAAGPFYVGAIDTFILSLFLLYLREKTGGLWANMTLHALKNGIAFVYLYFAVFMR
jgi:membrane protease YdiL (CAAX protease family)